MTQTLEALYYSGDNQDRIDYTPGAAVASGEVVLLAASLVGICTDPQGIAANALGSLAVGGIFKIKKDAIDTFALGSVVAWDDTANQAEPDGGINDDGSLGLCVEAAVAADDHVKTWINKAALI